MEREKRNKEVKVTRRPRRKLGIKVELPPEPYVVSRDLVPLLERWARENGFILPPAEFFDKLRREFTDYMKGMFPRFEFVHEDELAKGISELVSKLASKLVSEKGLYPIILSLDSVYYPTDPPLGITRLVDEKGEDRGYGRRPGTLPLLKQFREIQKLKKELEEKSCNEDNEDNEDNEEFEVILVDDVIFTGKLLKRIAKRLSKMGFKVYIVAGIGIGKGVEELKEAGYEVYCVRIYERVIDQVCERDFYPGVPFSGRTVVDREVGGRNVGAPYILPFGNPGKWASIPAKYWVRFSKFCIQQAIRLFEEIEKLSGRSVTCEALGRSVVTLPQDETRFVEALKKAEKSLRSFNFQHLGRLARRHRLDSLKRESASKNFRGGAAKRGVC